MTTKISLLLMLLLCECGDVSSHQSNPEAGGSRSESSPEDARESAAPPAEPTSRTIRGVFYVVDSQNRAMRMANTQVQCLRAEAYDQWMDNVTADYMKSLTPSESARRACGALSEEITRLEAQLEEVASKSSSKYDESMRVLNRNEATWQALLHIGLASRYNKWRKTTLNLSLELNRLHQSVLKTNVKLLGREGPQAQKEWEGRAQRELEDVSVSHTLTSVDGEFVLTDVPNSEVVLVAILNRNEVPTIFASPVGSEASDRFDLTGRHEAFAFATSMLTVTKGHLARAEEARFGKERRGFKKIKREAARVNKDSARDIENWKRQVDDDLAKATR